MPSSPPHPCLDCGTLVTPPSSPRCPPCTTRHIRTIRNPDHKRIYATRRWQAVRRLVLARQPYCATPGCRALAVHVDHIQPLRDHPDPYDPANLQGLCVPHHSRKTAGEIGWTKSKRPAR